jgi:hypothetical protein
MLASPPAAANVPRRIAGTGRHPVVSLLREVAKRPAVRHLRVHKGDELVEWRRAT